MFRKVVNISSIAGTGGNAGQANYSSGKAGIIGLTKAMSKEWGRYKVTVNAVAFGLIETRLTEAPAGGDATIDIAGPARSRSASTRTCWRRWSAASRSAARGTPEEAAGAVYLLCIPESNYVSGQT